MSQMAGKQRGPTAMALNLPIEDGFYDPFLVILGMVLHYYPHNQNCQVKLLDLSQKLP